MSYLTVSTDNVINTTNNATSFYELRRVFEEYFEIKVQEGYVLKYLNFQIFRYPLGFSVDKTDQIMELVNEWFPAGKFRKVDKRFRTESTHENDLMAALPLIENDLLKAEMEYNGKFGHTIGQIQKIDLMSTMGIYYTAWHLATQTLAPTIPGFQGINLFIHYLASHPHKPLFYPYNYYDGSNFIRLTWSGNQVEDYTTQNCL